MGIAVQVAAFMYMDIMTLERRLTIRESQCVSRNYA